MNINDNERIEELRNQRLDIHSPQPDKKGSYAIDLENHSGKNHNEPPMPPLNKTKSQPETNLPKDTPQIGRDSIK